MKLFCPYCTKEINEVTLQCHFCGTSYDSETIQLLAELAKVATEENVSERRRFFRFPKKFKIAYSTPKAFVENYLSHLSQGGVFIPTDSPFESGVQFNLKIILPDGKGETDIFCEVVWSQKEEKVTSEGRSFSGMGVKFLDISPGDRKRIDLICQEVKGEINKILGREET